MTPNCFPKPAQIEVSEGTAGAEWMRFALPGACGAGRQARGGNTVPIASAPRL